MPAGRRCGRQRTCAPLHEGSNRTPAQAVFETCCAHSAVQNRLILTVTILTFWSPDLVVVVVTLMAATLLLLLLPAPLVRYRHATPAGGVCLGSGEGAGSAGIAAVAMEIEPAVWEHE